MGKIQKKGEKGPNTMYITRTKALRKLQLSLNDFRRLCILKGIVPREPPNRKKANHGNSAPTAFYHVKDINFLAHEPMIQKLRDHKIFLRKMTTLLKKEEFSRARALEESRPVYKLDHIIKERQVQICLWYPTFIDAVRDLDDAICCVFLGASLTQHRRIPQGDLKDCARLAAEWQLYVMHTRSLRKVFLSIKGIYYQADVLGQTVTWIVPYQFTQDIPMDVDFRVMRTFLEFYKTLLGFVFYKLYADVGLVYPPPLDVKRDESGGSVDAYRLQQHSVTVENDSNEGVTMSKKVEDASGNVVTGKDVKKTIKSLGKEGTLDDTTEPQAIATAVPITQPTTDDALPTTEEFIARPSSSKTNDDPSQTSLVTLHALATTVPQTSALTSLFSPYTIFISRESPRHILEFVIKAFGGRVGWSVTAGSGSPFDESDESITHVIIDRPLAPHAKPLTDKERRRKYIQPQWVVDCVNAGKILLEDAYERGKPLPPHLSPFNAEGEGAYDPLAPIPGADEALEEEEGESEEEEDFAGIGDDDQDVDMEDAPETKHATAKSNPQPPAPSIPIPASDSDLTPEAIRRAELAAERQGIEPTTFDTAIETAAKKSLKAQRKAKALKDAEMAQLDRDDIGATEENMAKMLLGHKKQALYTRMKMSQGKKSSERLLLEQKKLAIMKRNKKEVKLKRQ